MNKKSELENRLKLIDSEYFKLCDALIYERDRVEVRSWYSRLNELKKEYFSILKEFEC